MAGTVLYPIIGNAACCRCARDIPRETRIALAIKTLGRGDWLDRKDELCAECARQPHITITEFAHYLAQSGFGPLEQLGNAPWRDPLSPCS